MTKMKKLISFVLAGAMTLAMSVSAFAATGVTAAEQKILDQAKVKAEELGVNTETSTTYKEYYAQAESYLAKNELSQTQIDAMVAAVDEAAATAKAEMAANGVTRLGDLDFDVFSALQNKVVDQITKAAEAVGIKIVKTSTGWAVQNLQGDTVVTNESVIKQTGSDMTTTIIMAVMFVGALSACVVVAKKRNLFAGVEA